MQNKANFRKSQMNVSIYSIMDYENISDWTLSENKPNSNPKQTKSNPNKANFHKAQMNANSCSTKDYENKRRRGLRKNKANQSQFPSRNAKNAPPPISIPLSNYTIPKISQSVNLKTARAAPLTQYDTDKSAPVWRMRYTR